MRRALAALGTGAILALVPLGSRGQPGGVAIALSGGAQDWGAYVIANQMMGGGKAGKPRAAWPLTASRSVASVRVLPGS
jgi:threonine/homoserine efflux transporter RhtA